MTKFFTHSMHRDCLFLFFLLFWFIPPAKWVEKRKNDFTLSPLPAFSFCLDTYLKKWKFLTRSFSVSLFWWRAEKTQVGTDKISFCVPSLLFTSLSNWFRSTQPVQKEKEKPAAFDSNASNFSVIKTKQRQRLHLCRLHRRRRTTTTALDFCVHSTRCKPPVPTLGTTFRLTNVTIKVVVEATTTWRKKSKEKSLGVKTMMEK